MAAYKRVWGRIDVTVGTIRAPRETAPVEVESGGSQPPLQDAILPHIAYRFLPGSHCNQLILLGKGWGPERVGGRLITPKKTP